MNLFGEEQTRQLTDAVGALLQAEVAAWETTTFDDGERRTRPPPWSSTTWSPRGRRSSEPPRVTDPAVVARTHVASVAPLLADAVARPIRGRSR